MRTILFSLLLGLLPALSSTDRPCSAADKKTEFEGLLKQAKVALDGGRYKEAKDILVTKLADHKGADYVKDKLEAIRADIKTCSFRLVFPKRDLKTLLDGDVTEFDAKSNQATIVYDRKTRESAKPYRKFPGTDLEAAPGGGWAWKFPFEGPFSLAFSGKSITELSPKVRVCIEDDDAYLFDFYRRGSSCLEHVVDGAATSIADASNMFNVLRPYTLKIIVRAEQIEVMFEGKRVLLGKKPKPRFGKASYDDFANLDRIEVEGKISKKWIDEQVDARSTADLAEFEKTYDAQADLPEWLR